MEREVAAAIQAAASGRRRARSLDHSPHDGIPMHNIWRMIEAARRNGTYRSPAWIDGWMDGWMVARHYSGCWCPVRVGVWVCPPGVLFPGGVVRHQCLTGALILH